MAPFAKMGDGEQDVPNRHLPIGEDGPAGDAELMAATAAHPAELRFKLRGFQAPATRAVRDAIGIGPVDRLEGGPRLFLAHTRNGR